MKLQDAVDHGKLPPETLPQGVLKSTPVMEDFSIYVAGILKLLRNVKPGKAAGPDKLKAILLKELSEEIAPIIQVIIERSFETGKFPAEWCRAQVTPSSKKVINHRLQTTDRSPPSPVFSARCSNIKWLPTW